METPPGRLSSNPPGSRPARRAREVTLPSPLSILAPAQLAAMICVCLYRIFEDRMLNRKPGHLVTIKDIAAQLKMSHTTVSRALNDRYHISKQTKERVRAAAEQLGYVANLSARMIRGDTSLTIGLLIPDVQNDFYSRISKELAERCRRAGGRMLLAITEDDPFTEENEIRDLVEARVKGIIATLTSRPQPTSLLWLREIPSIQLVRRTAKLNRAAVCMEDEHGCQSATEHLLNLGHRRIAYVGTSKA